MSDENDWLRRFLLENANVRGVLVRLESTWSQIRSRAAYPESVARLLGEALAATALFTGNIKFSGSLSIQLKHPPPLTLLYTECTDDGQIRGLARWQGSGDGPIALKPGDPDTLLAITIEQAARGQRYQGLVPVDDPSLARMFEHYFAQSEQLATRVFLAKDEGRCGAIMLQHVPSAGGVDMPIDADAWNRVSHLLDTLTAAELLADPAEALLLKLFPEETVRVFKPRALSFGCRCSRDRVVTMLRSLGRSEARETLEQHGSVEVTCEFCNQRYSFDAVDIEQVFHSHPVSPSSATPQ